MWPFTVAKLVGKWIRHPMVANVWPSWSQIGVGVTRSKLCSSSAELTRELSAQDQSQYRKTAFYFFGFWRFFTVFCNAVSCFPIKKRSGK